jgi:hypothetical protein
MAASGRPLDEEELVKYIITDLDDEYTPLVSALCARKEPILVSELYSQMLNFETRIGLFQEGNQYRSVNAANRRGSRGRGGSRGHRGGHASPTDRGTNTPTRRGGFDRGFSRGRRRSFNRKFADPVICQVYGKKNHTAQSVGIDLMNHTLRIRSLLMRHQAPAMSTQIGIWIQEQLITSPVS